MFRCLLKFHPLLTSDNRKGMSLAPSVKNLGHTLSNVVTPSLYLAVQLRQSTHPQHHHTTTPVHTVAGKVSVQLFRNYFIAVVSLSDSFVKFSP